MKKPSITLFIIAIIVAIAASWYVIRYSAEPTDQPDNSQPTGNTYTNADFGFSAVVPDGYSIDPSYFYYALGPGREIPGVKFTIPTSTSDGTNLSSDSGVSVELLSRAACTPNDFMFGSRSSTTVTLGSYEYMMATTSDAGAGNLYDETVYVHKNRDLCYGIRYFIHSTQLANYPAGTVRGFDRDALLKQFKSIAASVTFI